MLQITGAATAISAIAAEARYSSSTLIRDRSREMVAYIRVLRAGLAIFISGLMVSIVRGDAGIDPSHSNYERDVAVTATASKTVYKLGEAVSVALTISNNSQQSVYTFNSESDFATGFATVMDAGGKQIMGDPIPTPPSSPPNHYMERDGKGIYVVPIYQIKAHGVMKATMVDVLRIYHKHLTEGTYDLDLGSVTIIHEVTDLIMREDVQHRLWVEPSSPMTKVGHKLGTMKIEIRGRVDEGTQMESKTQAQAGPTVEGIPHSAARPESEPPISQGWHKTVSAFIGGMVAGMGALLIVLLIRKRLATPGNQ